jgi:hypothetical protein
MDSLVGLVVVFGGIFVVGVISSLIEGAIYRRRERRRESLLTQRSVGFPVVLRDSPPMDVQQPSDPASPQVPDPRF